MAGSPVYTVAFQTFNEMMLADAVPTIADDWNDKSANLPASMSPSKGAISTSAIYAKRAAAAAGLIAPAPNRKNSSVVIDADAVYAKRRSDLNRNPSPPARTDS